MIVGLDRNPPAGECFREIDEAVRQLRGDDRVCFNAHEAPGEVPDGAIVYNFENYDIVKHLPPPHWDFSERNCAMWREAGHDVKYVPVGYHPSMERFERVEPEWDVVFAGCINERRMAVFTELARRGLKVNLIPPGVYGKGRDDVLARARLCVVPLYYPEGTFCSLRAAHLTANGVPMLVESAPETWRHIPTSDYDGLVNRTFGCLRLMDAGKSLALDGALGKTLFRYQRMVLPC